MDTQISRLDLPSGGGWVEFNDLDDLTGADVHALRREIRAEDSSGETSNALLKRAAELLIKTWEVGYLADARTPEANPAWWKKLKLRDLLAIEHAVEPLLTMLRGGTPAPSVDDTSPGSPTPPGSE